ncbi:MAG: FecR/PupR family sigma factor regulator [Paraglaciecola sp.]|uniref:FecR/PupR family sigma factor regulator n=1 Tax=Paraglaciecola sp. TaxID=1920173 RepID=UPI0032983B0F
MNIEEWSGYEVSESVLAEAANWIAMLDSDTLDEKGQIAFYDWLQAQPAHQHAYIELSEMWAKSSCIKSMEQLVEKSKVLPFPNPIPKQDTQPDNPQPTSSPAWLYSLAIGLIFVGLSMPIIQQFV